MTHADVLIRRFESRDALVGVVGLGYVGLPVSVSFATEGFSVVGVETDVEKVEALAAGRSSAHDVPDEVLGPLVSAGRLSVSTSYEGLRDADVILICLPTPLSDGSPDLSMVVAGGEAVGRVLKRGALVILESTTYPGTTEEILKPLLEAEGRTAGADFLLAYSAERIDPGNPLFGFTDIPKVVGGIDAASTAAAAALYEQVVPKVIKVSGTREAELAKLIENTFRHVNIALVNELAIYAHEMGIDIWEAIEAAATKPFGYMPFWPSPGWGGHCIPLDPSFLSWRVRRDRAHEVRFVELAHTVNSEMSRHVAERIAMLLNDVGKPLKGAKILCIGAAYKGGTDDTRGSPTVNMLNRLKKRGGEVSYHDPFVETVHVDGTELRSEPLTSETLSEQDIVVILVRQDDIDWDLIVDHAPLVFDCCNALRQDRTNVFKL